MVINLDMSLEDFMNIDYGVIGRTASTRLEPNTSNKFQFWLSRLNIGEKTNTTKTIVGKNKNEVASVQIGNILTAVSDKRDDITFGLVTEMRSYSEVDSFNADYLSHDFGDGTIEVPTDISEVTVVTCAVMRNISLQTKPVGRSRVYFPSISGIQFAYGIIDSSKNIVFKGAPIPFGVFENGDGTTAPFFVDENFLVGKEGAHLNVFCTKSLLSHTQKSIAVVMFNVKSRDLLYIDQPNPKIEQEDWSRKVYPILETPAEPFKEAEFFAPADPDQRPQGTQSLRTLPTVPFEWDLQMMYHQIPALFDPMDWDDKIEGVWFSIQDDIESGKLITYSQMLNEVKTAIDRANQAGNQWIRSNHISTWQKMLSHLRRFPQSYRGLIATAGKGKDIPWQKLKSGGVFVIDISLLNDRGQRLVFGRSIAAISDMLEAR